MSLLISALRKKTNPLHREIEATYPFNALLNTPVGKTEYAHTLACLARWYQLIEASVLANLAPDLKTQLPVPALSKVLADDLSLLSEHLQADIAATQQPSIQFNRYEALGGLYVLLGSSLGAALVLKHLQQHGTPGLPSQFYQASAKNSVLWPEFLVYLYHFEQQALHAEIKQVVAAAEACFSILLVETRHFQKSGNMT